MRGLLPTLLSAALLAGAAEAAPLDGLRWSKRVLLVFSDDPARVAEQKAELSAAPDGALAERDLVVLEVPGSGAVRVLFGAPVETPDGAALRRAFAVPAGRPFTAVLVGKDGGSKWREERPATASELFRLIDAMPMRAREARANQG